MHIHIYINIFCKNKGQQTHYVCLSKMSFLANKHVFYKYINTCIVPIYLCDVTLYTNVS